MTTNEDDRYALPAAELCLENGWHAGIGVAPDGSVWPWLIAPDATRPGRALLRWPAHEDTGPLPEPYPARIAAATGRRCAAPTITGRPCAAPVRTPGARCWHHRTTTETPTERNH